MIAGAPTVRGLPPSGIASPCLAIDCSSQTPAGRSEGTVAIQCQPRVHIWPKLGNDRKTRPEKGEAVVEVVDVIAVNGAVGMPEQFPHGAGRSQGISGRLRTTVALVWFNQMANASSGEAVRIISRWCGGYHGPRGA
ncbi:hypothetical protein N7481_007304 [Penicillium waksmanii]|uniref:uncharacterized protein n=1 Tax=Penicillium waksmanii TaxID=69791 RepID=UPI00254841F8|nr:uncharacterized protein N7481_007304 [Penicillium waksmanii]KAJ5980006.1 hypothetical protein N7481_007304 [Penicillium waksmanii]